MNVLADDPNVLADDPNVLADDLNVSADDLSVLANDPNVLVLKEWMSSGLCCLSITFDCMLIAVLVPW